MLHWMEEMRACECTEGPEVKSGIHGDHRWHPAELGKLPYRTESETHSNIVLAVEHYTVDFLRLLCSNTHDAMM